MFTRWQQRGFQERPRLLTSVHVRKQDVFTKDKRILHNAGGAMLGKDLGCFSLC